VRVCPRSVSGVSGWWGRRLSRRASGLLKTTPAGSPPPPGRSRVTGNHSRWITPASRPLSRPPPAPFTGGGQCMAIDRIQCTGERSGIFGWGVHVDGREVVSSLALYLWRIAPWGVGVEHPPPLSRRASGNVFWGTPPPPRARTGPTATPLSAPHHPPPPPCRTPKTAPASPRISIIPAF